MPQLLAHLGIPVNERTRRAPCHESTNPKSTAFSWTEDGLWHCFRCQAGGDKYDLVKAVLKCDFHEALKVMAVLAGVNLPTISPEQRRHVRAQQRKERRLEIAAQRYAALERRWVCNYARRLLLLDRLEQLAAFCLRDSAQQVDESDSMEFWWDALARVYGERWHTLAAWLLLAFGAEDRRQRFVLYVGQRPSLLADVLDAGGVQDDRGAWRELAA